MEQKINQLATELEKLTNRVNSVERLLVIHDNVIRDKVVGSAGTPAPAPSDSKFEDLPEKSAASDSKSTTKSGTSIPAMTTPNKTEGEKPKTAPSMTGAQKP